MVPVSEHIVFFVSSAGEKVVEFVADSYGEAVAWATECQPCTDVQLRIEDRREEDDIPTDEFPIELQVDYVLLDEELRDNL